MKTSRYPKPVALHSKVRKAVNNISKPSVTGVSRFTSPTPRISGFNSGTVPKTY